MRYPGETVTYDTRSESNGMVDRNLRYRQILQILKIRPMTAKEVAVVMHKLGMIPTSERNFTAPRLTELCDRGLVEPIGKKRCQFSHRMVAVYEVRDAQER